MDNAAGTGVSKDLNISNDGGKVVVHWLVHGTSLLRCSPAHVRPFTEALREVQGERDHYFTAWREEERQSRMLIETIRKLQQQQAQGRDGQELVAAEVQVDTLNPELDERNYQCEVLFRRIGALERERIRLLEILEQNEQMHYREYVDTEPEDENSPRSNDS